MGLQLGDSTSEPMNDDSIDDSSSLAFGRRQDDVKDPMRYFL